MTAHRSSPLPTLVTDGGYDAGAASHAVLLELRQAATRHPAVTSARGEPTGVFTRVHADLDATALGASVATGALTIRWFAGKDRDAAPTFSFHYNDDTGFDCGWHHEPNPHVEGRAHFQERESTDDAYDYEPVSFGSLQPVRVLWEVLDRLADVLAARD